MKKNIIIGISGKIGSGKNTVADIIKKHNKSFQEIAFAYKLKQIVSILSAQDINNTMSQTGKNIYIPEFNMSIGEMLQKVGTDLFRDNFNVNTWVIATFLQIFNNPGNYIITDCRFKNEAKAIKDNGGILLRINRSNNNISTNSTRNLQHQSEIDLDDYTAFDYIINNDTDLQDLEKKVIDFMKNINIF